MRFVHVIACNPMLTRRSFLARAAAAGAAAAVPGLSAWPAQGAQAVRSCRSRPFRTSLSVSPFTEEVLGHVHLVDARHTARTLTEVQALFNRHGATEVYARIATRRHAPQGGGEIGWARGLQRARLARNLSMPFNPELGLWAVYGDASSYQQPPDFSDYPGIRLPGPWTSLTLGQMEHALRHYGALVARQILRTGVQVGFWDLGNEVDTGVAGVTVRPLFPDASYRAPDRVDPQIGTMSVASLVAMSEHDRIAWCQAHLWPYVGRLLSAVAAGIRTVQPGAKFSTHISGFAQPTPNVQLAFWQSVRRAGYLPDQLGTSYYPTQGKTFAGAADTLAWFKQLATEIGRRYRRQVFIAEYGYPSGHMTGSYSFNDTVAGFPQSPGGQARFTRELVTWGVRTGRLAGIRPWAPDLVLPGWGPMSFFAQQGRSARARPGLRAVAQGLADARLCEVVAA